MINSDKPIDNVKGRNRIIERESFYEPMQYIQKVDKVTQKDVGYSINELPINEESAEKYLRNLGI